MRYYVGTIPISDELYHHGIKGQKWGVRRYQNLDRTLTAAGKARYAAMKAGQAVGKAGKAVGRGIAKAGRATGSAVKAVARHKIQKIKENHLWMMSKDELNAYKDRLVQEKLVKDAVRNANYSRGKEFVKGILEKGGNTLANKAFEAIGQNVIAKQQLKNDLKYSKKMAERTAKNKLMIDKMVDKGQRRQTRKDPSSLLAKDIKKNFKTMSDEEIEKKANTYKKLKDIENRYRGTVNPTAYYSSKKG